MRHHPRVVSHIVLNDRQQCYLMHSQQLGLVLLPCLYRPCDSCFSLLHQHVIQLQILVLIDPLHILDQLGRIGGHVCVASMGIGCGATCILRRRTICRGKIMLPSPLSAHMSVWVRNCLPLGMWCTMVRILSGMREM
jgi:hypothetical protein